MTIKIFPYLFTFLSVAILVSCQKGTGSNKNGGNSATQPIVSVSIKSLAILLPGNCEQSFVITNIGPQGSTLNYIVKDDGAVSGFLSFTNSIGTLPAGASVTITVNVKANAINNPSLIGESMALDVYTPQASNYVKIPVTVNINSIFSAYSKLIGTWTGTWTGTSEDTAKNLPGYLTQVSGTWQVNFVSADTVKGTIAGTLTWKGTDNYWTYSLDSKGTIIGLLPNHFIPDRTINFNASNSTIVFDPSSPCSLFKITIGYNGPQGTLSMDAFYGPWITAKFDINAKTANNTQVTNNVTITSEGFLTHPYNPITLEAAAFPSGGFITATKN